MSTTKDMLKRLAHLVWRSKHDPGKKTPRKLRALLKKLKARQRELQHALETEEPRDHRKGQLKREIEVIRAQRRKGLRAYRKLLR